MVTRFVPGGYQPEHADEPTRGAGAPGGRRARRPDRRLRVPLPAASSPTENLDEVREALGGHDIYCIATGPAPRPALRPRRARLARRGDPRGGASRARSRRPTSPAELGAHFIIWPGIEGYNYPFQTPVRGVLGAGSSTGSARRRSAAPSAASTLFLEHKNSEPAMKILMRNIGMTLHVIHKLRAQRSRRTSRSTWTGSTCS